MRTTFDVTLSLRLAAALAFVLTCTGAPAARAFELSHYSALPGLVNPGDLFMPPPEVGQFVYAQYNAYYTTDTFRNSNGKKVDEITIMGPLGQKRTLSLDLDVDNWTIAPLFLWAPSWDVLGGRYAAAALIPFGNPTVSASLTSEIGFGRSIDESTVDIADIFLQPLWLQWSVSRADLTFAYGFYAPTGKYEVGAPDNVGLGFWSHQLQSAGRWHFDEEKSLIAFLAFTGEINHNKEDVDVVPGPHFTINWGMRKDFLSRWLEFGVIGYSTWQVADDSGSDALSPSVRDQVHAAGFQLGAPRLGLAVKYLHEFQAEDRFEGQTVTFSFALPLDPVLNWIGGKLSGGAPPADRAA